MIENCVDRDGKVLLELHFDASKLMQRACERTQAAATSMRSNDGAVMFEEYSATSDNAWMLQQWAIAAWREIRNMCMAYLCCSTAPVDSDEVNTHYAITLSLPKNWNSTYAVSIDGAIEEYIIASIAGEWWVSKGVATHAEVEAQRVAQSRSTIKYGLNVRNRDTGRPIRY